MAGFGNIGPSFLCAFADGSVSEIDATVDAQTLTAMASAQGGETYDRNQLPAQETARRAAAVEAAAKKAK